MKKTFSVLMATVLAAATLAACGSSKAPETAAATTAQGTEATTAAASEAAKDTTEAAPEQLLKIKRQQQSLQPSHRVSLPSEHHLISHLMSSITSTTEILSSLVSISHLHRRSLTSLVLSFRLYLWISTVYLWSFRTET